MGKMEGRVGRKIGKVEGWKVDKYGKKRDGRGERKKIEKMRSKGRMKCLNEEGLEERERLKERCEGRLERRKVGR